MKTKILLVSMMLLPFYIFSQQKVTVIAGAGYAWRTAKTQDNLSASGKNYIKQLKSGVNFDVAAYYNLGESMGLGIKYNLYSTSGSGTVAVRIPDNTVVTVSLNTKDRIHFIGPSFLYSNFDSDTRHKLYYDLSIGLISYISTTNNIQIKGSNLGVSANFGYMYQLTPNILVGPQVGFTGGVLKKMKENGVEKQLDKNEYEGLHRVSLGVGAAFRI